MELSKWNFGAVKNPKTNNKTKPPKHYIFLLREGRFSKAWFKENMIFWNWIICWNEVYVWFGCKPNNSGSLTARLTQLQLQSEPKLTFRKHASNKHIFLDLVHPQVLLYYWSELESQLSLNFGFYITTLSFCCCCCCCMAYPPVEK